MDEVKRSERKFHNSDIARVARCLEKSFNHSNAWIMSVSAASTDKKEEIEDPVERMLKNTGCIQLHYQVQDCFADTQDWRKCQSQIKQFKECMDIYRKKQEESYKSS